MRVSKCPMCGANIILVPTNSRKFVSCNQGQIHYIRMPNGSKRAVSYGGEILSCEYTSDPHKATGIGYVPHCCTCSAKSKTDF